MLIGRIRQRESVHYAASDGRKVVFLSSILGIDDNELTRNFFEIYRENEDRITGHDLSGVRGIDGPFAMEVPVEDIPNIRDFYAFEEHVRNGRKNRGLDMAKEWYDFPVFYFSNTSSTFPSGADIRFPVGCTEKDFEAEFAFVVGSECRDLSGLEYLDCIIGVTAANDWSARDIQKREVKVGLGPAKGKDFATSIGPWIVTKDSIRVDRKSGRISLGITSEINGLKYTDTNLETMHWTAGELMARASESTRLVPGDIIMTGTVGNGCLLETGGGPNGWLKSGDTVSIEVEGAGKLTNRII
ncbi:MAG: fumarylacetoacetate hydrolase family protein [Candidatus Thermoplasmatota archaeon]|nr:fumarylacetoacetate hydrolase family protein [Candidatus Thermoplasmatota archaeon]